MSLATDALRATGRELLEAMVAIPSPSGDEDEAAIHLRDLLRDHGREAYLDEVGNVRAPGDPDVLLTSHIDTVEGEIPVHTETDDDGVESVLWGRGSVDATGALVALAIAAIHTGVSFVGVVGEETDSRGARHLVECRHEPLCVINGEPSGWEAVAIGYRGLMRGTYAVEIDRVHGSSPAPNAIETAANWLSAAGDDAPIPSESITVSAEAIEGGLAASGLATEATLEFAARIPPGVTPVGIREQLEAVAPAGSFAWSSPIPAYCADPRSPPATALRGAIRAEGGRARHVFKGGTSDANLYAAGWDCPVVTYGPGDSTLDHTAEERLSLAEFERSIAVLCRAVDTLVVDGYG